MSGTGETIDFQLGVTRRVYGCWLTGRRVNEVSVHAEAMLLRLTLIADDFGNCPGSAASIKAMAFPRRKVSEAKIEAWIDELEATDPPLATRYTDRGETYIHIEAPEGRTWSTLQPTRNGKRFQKYPLSAGPGESKRAPGNPKHPNQSSAALSPVAPVLKLALSPEHDAVHPERGEDGASIHSAGGGASGLEPEDRVLLHFAKAVLSSVKFHWGRKREIHPDAIETLLQGPWSLESIWLALARVSPKHTDPVGYVLSGAASDWQWKPKERAEYAAWYEKTVRPTMDRATAQAAKAAGGSA